MASGSSAEATAIVTRSIVSSRFERAARLVVESRDLLDARPREEEPPESIASRGWAEFLLGIDDAELAALEMGGLDATWPDHAPSSLVTLAAEARAVCDVGSLDAEPVVKTSLRRLETPRKRAQIDAFARVVAPLATRASRIVDVGSGHGHLTRDLAERFALPVVGLERDDALAGRARSLSAGASPSFAVTDVLRDGLSLSGDDCVVGLHACGELGDAMVAGAARSGASIALVGCCMQKRRGASWRPLRAPGQAVAPGDALELPKRLLGLSNLTACDDGVETNRAANLAGRERRLALYRLLSARDPALRPGAEIEGLNRRAAQGDLASLVRRAFALRGLEAPSSAAIDEAAGWARVHHPRLRRLSVPRMMLARTLEVLILCDRARYLEDRDFSVAVGALFPPDVSPRNLALVAARVA